MDIAEFLSKRPAICADKLPTDGDDYEQLPRFLKRIIRALGMVLKQSVDMWLFRKHYVSSTVLHKI